MRLIVIWGCVAAGLWKWEATLLDATCIAGAVTLIAGGVFERLDRLNKKP